MSSINLFIPETIKYIDSGFLNGKYLLGKYETEEEPPLVIIDEKIEQKTLEDSIGEISNKCVMRSRTKSFWIVVETKPSFTVSSFVLDGKVVNVGNINLVFYNSLEIRHSYLLCNSNCQSNSFSKSMDHFIQRVKAEDPKQKTTTPNYFKKKMDIFFCFYLSVILGISVLLRNINEFLMRRFDSKSFAVAQLLHRCKQIEKLVKCIGNREDLIWKRIVGVLLVDVLLGFLSCYYMYSSTSALELHSCFQASVEVLASNVQALLNWLSGAPAGLKLNQPLSESLASFSSYHVYLWTLYLEVADPIVFVIAHLFMFVGLFGISLQVACLVDFMNLVVLHIHCIYIYTARLHMLQMSLLGSQWRAFRGRKWNPLKERVDTRSEGRQRPLIKIISAVGFTLVVFLLPTTTVYYSVFVTLRLVLMSLKGLVCLLLWALNSNPVYIVYLHMTGSPLLKGKFHFEMERSVENAVQRPIYFRLTIKASPLREVVAAADSPDVFPVRPCPNTSTILKSLLYAKDLL